MIFVMNRDNMLYQLKEELPYHRTIYYTPSDREINIVLDILER